MLVVIDESGDPGFAINSSKYFVLGMVCFPDFRDAEHASRRVSEVRLKHTLKGEFKFSATRHDIKRSFFEHLAGVTFKVRAVVVQKSLIQDKRVKHSPSALYMICLRHLLGNTAALVPPLSIKFDKYGNREFRYTCAAFIRQELPAGTIKTFKPVDSHKDNLIQLADMVTGAIARPYNSPTKSDAAEWMALLQQTIGRNNVEIVTNL